MVLCTFIVVALGLRWPQECIVAHKEESRSGVSRATIKKVRSRNPHASSYAHDGPQFVGEKYGVDATTALNLSHLNRAIMNGAEEGIFALPKGPSGKVKLAPKTKPAPVNEVRSLTVALDVD